MTDYERLTDKVIANDIYLNFDRENKIPAVSLKRQGMYGIFMDERAFRTESERRVALAHELGHCLADAFCDDENYSINYGRCEYRAWRSAVTAELPLDALMEAVSAVQTADTIGINIGEVANFLGFTPLFVEQALDIYTRMGLI
ncbi:hypothetical protein FACS1894202_14090 [Clostridia bacterium]|nr:hypothetical protein FACS1894202_14090 [Clostridia bacterium]